jgi:Spy/CpxP family protein refolding chaperone
MKKLFFLAALFTALVATTASAQGGPGGDPAAMRQRMKERFKPQLVEKTKISDEQADKVLDIYIDAQRQRREVRMDQNLSDEDKAKKTAAIDEEAAKKYKAIPLKDEETKAVASFFEEARKNMPQRREGGNN